MTVFNKLLVLLYRRIKDHQDQVLLQQDLGSLEEREHTWQMKFNTSKYNVIRIMPNKRRETLTSNYSLHGQTLETKNTNKYLGINISSDISWSNHVEDVAARGNRTMGFLRRNFRECTPKVKTATYITLVRPTLEYASAVWDPYKQKDAQLLENVQRRAARYVNNNYKDRSPGCVTSMLENLKWTNLEHRRRQIRLGMLYKINKGLVDINPANFFHHADRRTEEHNACIRNKSNTLPSFTLSSLVQYLSGTTSQPLSPQPLHWSPSRVD